VISFKDFQEISGSTFDPLSNDDALTHLFNSFDTKQEGYLYAEDIVEAAKTLKISLSVEEAAKIIEAMDFDRDGAVDIKEFKQVVKA
jgi:Ca2+-binding EF-hand superfamily protein